MIDKQWINVGTISFSLVLLLFAMVQTTLSLALNLRYANWGTALQLSAESPTIVSTGVLLTTSGLLVYPAVATGICAAVSRHIGVYITLVVLDSLAILAAIGGLVTVSVLFGQNDLFSDSNSMNDELGICVLVFQALLVVALMVLGMFGIMGIVYHEKKRGTDGQYKPKYDKHRLQPYQPVRYIDSGPSYPVSYSKSHRRGKSDVGFQRSVTYGNPEWDRFYDQLWRNYGLKSPEQKSHNRSTSYRY